MKTFVMRKSTVSKRKPYDEAVARLRSYHQAGHIVVGHAMGMHVISASPRGTEFKPVVVGHPEFASSDEDRSERIAAHRRCMAAVAAGHVAATIHQEATDREVYSSSQERRAYRAWWEIRASTQIALNMSHVSDPGTNSWQLAESAKIIVPYLGTRGITEPDPVPKEWEWMWKKRVGAKSDRAVVAEVLRAEERAEHVLMRYCGAVSDVAYALRMSEAGPITRKQILPLLKRHSVPVEVAD